MRPSNRRRVNSIEARGIREENNGKQLVVSSQVRLKLNLKKGKIQYFRWEELKKLLSPYNAKPLTFIVSDDYFTKKMFNPSFYKYRSILKSLGLLFDKKKVAVLSTDQKFSVTQQKLKSNQENTLKDYLVAKKQIVDI